MMLLFIAALAVLVALGSSAVVTTPPPSKSPTFSPTMYPTQSIPANAITLKPTGPYGLTMNTLATDDTGENIIGRSISGPIFVSQDYGYTWTQTPLPMNAASLGGAVIIWNKPVISGNGKYFYASNDQDTSYYVSTNPSSSWSQVAPIAMTSGAYSNIYTMAVDYSGNHIFLGGYFYSGSTYMSGYGAYSVNGGSTFVILTSLTQNCASVAIDNTGLNLVCLAYTTNQILISKNGGITFSTMAYLPASLASTYYSASHISTSVYNSNQMVYVPAIFSPNVYVAVSSNNGGGFTDEALGSLNYVNDISTTGNGQKVYLATSKGIVYSTNAGVTWSLGYSYLSYAVAVSGSGANLYVQSSGGLLVNRNTTTYTASPTAAPTTLPSFISWKSVTLPSNSGSSPGYQFTALSNNGSYILAAPQYGNPVSYTPKTSKIVTGKVIVPATTTINWYALTMSSDGNRAIGIINYAPFYMFNRTMSFHQASMYSSSLGTFNSTTAVSCAMNENGNVILIGGQPSGSSIWLLALSVSPSSATTFSPVFTTISTFPSILTSYCKAIGVDSTGLTLIAICESSSGYISTNQGLTWTALTYPTSTNGPTMLTVSQLYNAYDIYAISGYYCNIEVSMNQGKSWSSNSISTSIQNVFSVQTSSNGQVIAIATNNGYYVSYNYGVTFSFVLQMTFPYGVSSTEQSYIAIDSSGTFLAAVQSDSTVLKIGYHTYTPAPSTAPTYAPSKAPTTSSYYTAGWIYSSTKGYSTVSVPIYFSGYRLGICFASTSDGSPSDIWYQYSCTDSIIQVDSYNNAQCSGNPISSQTMSNPYSSDSYNTVTCVSQSSLPALFDNGYYYSIDQYYEDITPNVDASTCYLYDVVRFDAYINNVCIGSSIDGYYYANYPWIASYVLPGCKGSVIANISLPTGCTTNSTYYADASIKVANPTTASAAHPLKFNSQVDNSVVVDEAQLGLLSPSLIIQKMFKTLNGQDILDEGSDNERKLGLFYNYYDDYVNFPGHSYYRYPYFISIDISVSTLSTGVIIGIVIGTVCGCCILLGCIAFLTGGLACLVGNAAAKNSTGTTSTPASAPMPVDVELAEMPKNSSEGTTIVNPVLAAQQAK